MNKTFKKIIPCALAVFTLMACGKNDDPTSSGQTSYTPVKVTLKQAIKNTRQNYQLNFDVSLDFSFTYQIYSPDFYYYGPLEGGYIRIAEDNEYYHNYSAQSLEGIDDISRWSIDVNGRIARVEDQDLLFTIDFMDILDKYCDDFTKIGDNIYGCYVTDFAYDCKDYFQSKSFVYCNYFELIVGDDGRLKEFIPCERTATDKGAIANISFHDFNLSTYEPYTIWSEAGRNINLRLIDLKYGANFTETSYQLLYENEECSIEGTVASYDYDNNIIMTVKDNNTGNVGVEVQLKDKDSLPAINEKIKVTGTIKQNRYVAKITDATYESLGKDDTYGYFDEDMIADTYGGGYYAANIFAFTPIYADSIYSTFAYVEAFPTNEVKENQRTIVTLICPKMISEDGDVYHMQLVLPASMSVTEKQEILDDLKQYGIYNKDDNTATELYLDRMIMRFSSIYSYHIQLEYGSESVISKHLTPMEKVEKVVGLKNFPFPNVDTYSCFAFGNSTGFYIEENYGKEKSGTQGVYYNVSSLTYDLFDIFMNNIESYGFTFYNEIKDSVGERHKIYKFDEYYLDMTVYDALFEEAYTVSFWIYKGELVQATTIKEKLASAVPFFNADDFIQPSCVLDSNITLWNLPEFAGNEFENGITCVSLDSNLECFADLKSGYSEKGYAIARTNDNKQYTYKTRGANHYVYYKEIPNSKDKIYVDMAMYSTNDYTFADHTLFTYRYEVLIYRAEAPLNTIYADDLSEFSNFIAETYGDTPFNIQLPEGVKIEQWKAPTDKETYAYISYGYFFEYNVFIYPSTSGESIPSLFNKIVNCLKEHGYVLGYTSTKGNECYNKKTGDSMLSYSYVFVMKTDSYVRLIEGTGGIDF